MSLPIDLLSLVITHAWSSPLIPRERIQFMTASRLVSKGWSAVHDMVSSSNVHIPCESFYHHFFRRAANRLDRCKRITFTVCNYRDEREATVPPSLTYMRNADIKKLVSLHTIHLVYHDMMFPDPYVQVFFYALPSYLERLIISYNFSPRVPLSAIDFHLKDFTRYSKTRYAEPLVGTLEVTGADGFITAVWESLFPNPKQLLMDGKEVRLMKATSNFDRQHALLVHFEDCERQKLAARRRQIRTLTGSRSAGTDADGVASVTGKTACVVFPCSSPAIEVNASGCVYTALPIPWFNTYKLHAVGEFTYLGTYGEVKAMTSSQILKKILGDHLVERLNSPVPLSEDRS